MLSTSQRPKCFTIIQYVFLVFLLSMNGCRDNPDEQSTATTSPSQQTPPQPKSHDQPRVPSESGHPSAAWHVGLDALDTEPQLPTLGKILAEQTASPDSQTIVESGPVKLTIPAGLVDTPTTVCVCEVKEVPPVSDGDDFKTLGQWDVTIGDKVILPQPIRLDIQLDIPADILAHRDSPHYPSGFHACYWDPYFKTWVALPCTVNPETNIATVVTQHLCVISMNWNYIEWDIAGTQHFKIHFYDSTIRDDPDMGDKAFPNKLDNTEKQICQKQVDQFEVPFYVTYASYCIERAHDAYQNLGFDTRVPLKPDEVYNPSLLNAYLSDSKIRVYLMPFGSSLFEKFTGEIWVSLAEAWQASDVRIATSHELMHAVQANLLKSGIASQEFRRAWLEAQAEYATRVVWQDRVVSKMPWARQDFLRKPLSLTDDMHEYQTSSLIRYMVETRQLCTFAELVTNTLQLSDGMLLFDYTAAVTYAADKGRRFITQEQESKVVDVVEDMSIFKPLRDFCKSKGTSLGEVYRDFSAYLLFDADCSWMIVGKDAQEKARNLRGVLANAHALTTLKLKDREKTVSLSARTKGVCDYAAIQVEHTPEEIQAGKKKTVEVVLEGDIFSGTDGTTDLYLLEKGMRQAGIKPLPIQGKTANRQVTVGPNDVLTVLVANTGMTQTRNVTVRVRHLPTLEIKPASVKNGEMNKPIDFKVTTRDLPPELPQVEFVWEFEEDEKLNGRQTRPVAADGSAEWQFQRTFPEEKDYPMQVWIENPATGKR